MSKLKSILTILAGVVGGFLLGGGGMRIHDECLKGKYRREEKRFYSIAQRARDKQEEICLRQNLL